MCSMCVRARSVGPVPWKTNYTELLPSMGMISPVRLITSQPPLLPLLLQRRQVVAGGRLSVHWIVAASATPILLHRPAAGEACGLRQQKRGFKGESFSTPRVSPPRFRAEKQVERKLKPQPLNGSKLLQTPLGGKIRAQPGRALPLRSGRGLRECRRRARITPPVI